MAIHYEYYSILEIEQNATEGEIKKAYRKKAMELHPDRHGGDKQKEEEFKKLNAAYATLSDPQKRAHYDRFGTTEGMGGFASGFGGGFDAGDLQDIFSQFFSGGFAGGEPRTRRRADIGEDIEIRLRISLEDAIRGVSRKISYDRAISCEHCHGQGGETETCEKCHGSGQVRARVETIFGIIEQKSQCPDCRGTGKKIIKKCEHCHGTGKITEKIEKTIEVPKGIEDGMSIKMRGEGHIGRDGSGDLYVTFSVPDREGGLIRRGADLHFVGEISPALATLGGQKEITIPILGKKELSIKSGTQHGSEIRFAKEGLVSVEKRHHTGDLIIHIDIRIPQKISADQKKLYEALLHSEGGQTKKGWLEELFGK